MTTAVPRRSTDEFDLERELVKVALSSSLFGSGKCAVQIGRFEVLRCLGRGGTGAVYDAVDSERGGQVALKVLSRLEPGAIYRLKREFRSLCDVLHPNLVKLHELFHVEGQWFFTMELLEGEPFDRWVRSAQGQLDATRLRGALLQLAHAVQAIHGAGQLHRDLKPSNVLVTDDGRVVVLDFGLATGASVADIGLTRGAVLGTPAYMAPEQAAGAAATRASDWYAVGVMLFEALTGQLPFPGDAIDMIHAKQRSDAPDPRTASGDAPAALCELCISLLKRDPAERGGCEQVLLAAGARTAAPGPGGRRESVFVGREGELGVLADALTTAALGQPVVVLLPGSSGMGKSALLERFAELAAPRALVLRGRCYEQESVPYKVFDGVADALGHYLSKLPREVARGLLPRHLPALVRLFPVLYQGVGGIDWSSAPPGEVAEPRELRSQAFDAFKELLLNVSRTTPVVIAVDDLQWGDSDSARMLRHLLASPGSPPLLFVGAYRDGDIEESDFLRAASAMLGRTPGLRVRRVAVGPLERDVAAELARRLLGDAAGHSDAIARTITHEALGLPFFIAELARSAQAAGAPTMGATSSLEQLILERVASLPPDARRLLQLLSAAASPLERSAAIEAAGLPASDWVALHALRNARLIRTRSDPGGDLLEIYHDRIRETVVRNLSEHEIRAAHASIVRALECRPAVDPERLVVHLEGAGEKERAGEAAVQAARAAFQKLAFDRAVALFERACSLLPGPRTRELELQRQLGDALVHAGRGLDAAAAYQDAAQRLDPKRARHMLRLAAKYMLRSGRPLEGAALARNVIAALGIRVPTRESLWPVLWERARLTARGLRFGQRRRSEPAHVERMDTLRDLVPELISVSSLIGFSLHTRYLREALDDGEPEHLLHGLVWEVFNSALIGGPRNERRAERVMGLIGPLAARVGTPHARGLAYMAEASRHVWEGRQYAQACAAAQAAHDIFGNQCSGAFWERSMVAYLQFLALEPLLELPRHAALTEQHRRDASERDDQFTAATLMLAEPVGYLMADDVQGCLDYLEGQRGLTHLSFDGWLTWWVRIAQALSYDGRSREAAELTEANWATFRRSPYYGCEFVRENMFQNRARHAVAAYCETGDPAWRALAWRTTLAIRNKTTVFGAYRASLLGSLHAAAGQRELALRALDLSRDRFTACQVDGSALIPERVKCELTGDHRGVDRIDEQLRRRGVRNPLRWSRREIPILL